MSAPKVTYIPHWRGKPYAFVRKGKVYLPIKNKEMFTELEYIQSTGTQWIYTATDALNVYGVDFVFSPQSGSAGGYAILLGNQSNNFNLGYVYTSYTSTYVIYRTAECVARSSIVVDEKYHLTVLNNVLNNCGKTSAVDTTLPVGTLSGEIVLGNFGGGMTEAHRGAAMKIYSLKFYAQDNVTLVRDFIPVLDASGVPCMFDKVTQTFFYNAGTGDFLYKLKD